jgi:hypothetical protein
MIRSADLGDPALRIRLARRLFTRPCVPLQGEPAHGYFLRLSEAHRQPSVVLFAREVDINIDWGDQSACLAVVLENDALNDADRAALIWWTPVLDGAFVRVAGEQIRRDDLSINTRRFCPACLHESPHHRMWFDCLFMVTCPLHGTAIVDSVAGSPVAGFHHALIDHSPTGTSFAFHHPRLSKSPPTPEAYALGRWGLMDQIRNDFLDPFPLSDIIEASELLGRLVIGRRLPSMPTINSPGFEAAILQKRGFAVLQGGPGPIKELLGEIAAEAPPSTFGIRTLFGWAGFNFRFKSDLALAIVGLMGDVGMELGRRGRIRGYVAGVDALMTIKEATEKLEDDRLAEIVQGKVPKRKHAPSQDEENIGFSQDAVSSVARLFGLFHPHSGRKGSPLLLPRTALPVIADVLKTCLMRSAAVKYLAVSKENFDDIVLAGHIRKLGTRWGDSGLEDRFELAELERFLDRIPLRKDESADLKPSMTICVSSHIPTVSRMLAHTQYEAGRFFTEVFAGEIVVMTRTSLAGGLSAFRIHLNDQSIGHAFTGRWISLGRTRKIEVGDDRMSQRQACALLDINPPTAKALVDAGYIATAPSMNRSDHVNLDRASVLRFSERYIAGKHYAELLGCQSSKVNLRVAERGVLPLIELNGANGKTNINPVYARDDMRSAFGFKTDPDKTDIARLGWKKMADFMGREASVFALWHVYDGIEAMFSTADRLWPMRVSYKFDEVGPYPELDDSYAYSINVDLKISGLDAEKRIDAFEKICASRMARVSEQNDADLGLLDLGVKAYVNRTEGSCHASMKAFAVNGHGRSLSKEERFAKCAEQDSELIWLMLNIIKCSFEEGRPYDADVFGIWPTRFTRDLPSSMANYHDGMAA